MLLMQYLTLKNDVSLCTIANLLKTLGPAGYHNPRLKRLDRHSTVLETDYQILPGMQMRGTTTASEDTAELEPADLQQQQAATILPRSDAPQRLVLKSVRMQC